MVCSLFLAHHWHQLFCSNENNLACLSSYGFESTDERRQNKLIVNVCTWTERTNSKQSRMRHLGKVVMLLESPIKYRFTLLFHLFPSKASAEAVSFHGCTAYCLIYIRKTLICKLLWNRSLKLGFFFFFSKECFLIDKKVHHIAFKQLQVIYSSL